MGKFESGHDLARSKYLIVGSVAAIAMVLGAMSVGARFRQDSYRAARPVLGQIYPIPANRDDNGSRSAPDVITKPSGFTNRQTIPLVPTQDWSKKILQTDPVNIQVRVGLTKAATIQINTTLGANVSVPTVVNDPVSTVADIDEDTTGNPEPSPGAATAGSTDTQTPADGQQTPLPTGQIPSASQAGEQAAALNASLEIEPALAP
ncbi:MAG TPA: hypothetical protein VFT16_00160 [Candidatus Saccharimonadales bacterium]|nr:hypothetical protein [Candidatus Saccharimonadales bacterium]